MQDITILAFGDSITYGAWDKELGGWVNRLRLKLEKDLSNNYYNIYNLGIPDETTVDLIKRFASECNTRFNVANNKTIIIIYIGINDTQNINGKVRVSLEDFKNNINILINKAKVYTNRIIFIGLNKVNEELVNPVPWDLNRGYTNNIIVKYDNIIEEECQKNNIEYIKIDDLLRIEDLADGLHPNEVGHKKICDIIKNKIEKGD